MKDTSWIKPQLKELFAGKYDWLGFNQLYKEKLDRFNGKLYKYYSFSKRFLTRRKKIRRPLFLSTISTKCPTTPRLRETRKSFALFRRVSTN